MSDIHKHIVEKIQREHIVPKARWRFVLAHVGVWLGALVSLVVGSIASTMIFFSFANAEWVFAKTLYGSHLRHVITVIPYVWLLSLGVFVVCAQYALRHTTTGYRWSVVRVVVILVVVSVVGGGSLYAFGAGNQVDQALSERVPRYERALERKQRVWHMPEEGRVAGVVREVVSSTTLHIVDPQDGQWTVVLERSAVRHADRLHEEERFAFLGEQVATSTFVACHMRPLTLRGLGRMKPRDQHERNMIPVRRDRCGSETTPHHLGLSNN